MNHNTFFVADLPPVYREGVFIGTLCTGNGPGLHQHNLVMISQSLQPVTENYRRVLKRATAIADGTPVTLNITNFQSVWMKGHKECRIHALWGKMFQTNTIGNVAGQGMHAVFISLGNSSPL